MEFRRVRFRSGVDGEDTPAVPGHDNPEDLDISGIDVERHESARAPVDAVVAQEDAVLARLHRGMHKAVLLHVADVLVVNIDFGLNASGDQERRFPPLVSASLSRKRIEPLQLGGGICASTLVGPPPAYAPLVLDDFSETVC